MIIQQVIHGIIKVLNNIKVQAFKIIKLKSTLGMTKGKVPFTLLVVIRLQLKK